MKFIYGIVFFCLVVLASMLTVYLVALPAAVLFAYWYDGRYLIAAAVALDAYYGAFVGIPWFSLVALAIYVVVALVSPRLRTM